MTREQNVFWAKRNIVDYIWKSLHLEGLKTTYPSTDSIFNKYVPAGTDVSEVIIINNLKHSWYYVLNNLDEVISLEFIQEIHKNVGAGLIPSYGQIRDTGVKIGGTLYIPKIPNEFLIRDFIYKNNEECTKTVTERALDLLVFLMRTQMFLDGNKRTSIMVANSLLIRNGCGIISIEQKNISKFNEHLVDFYETNDPNQLKKFLYDNCIDGCNFK